MEDRIQRRRRRERIIILLLLIAIVLVTYAETQVMKVAARTPASNSIIIFGLININLILFLLLVFLILRNIVKLYFERRQKLLGAKLQSKLVLAFLGISLVPTLFLFLTAGYYISSSTESWFSENVENTLKVSLDLARAQFSTYSQQSTQKGIAIAQRIREQNLLAPENRKKLNEFIKTQRAQNDLGAIDVLSPEMESLAKLVAPDIPAVAVAEIPARMVKRALTGQIQTGINDSGRGSRGAVVQSVIPILSQEAGGKVAGALIVSYFIPPSIATKIHQVAEASNEYQQLMIFKRPIKTTYLLPLLLITLSLIFSATWLGFYLAKGITVPIRDLAEATQKVAGGNLDFQIQPTSGDEIGTLVNAFNKMTADLKLSQQQIEEARTVLEQANEELEQRRNYMEFILSNITAGVLSLDEMGRISTMNPAAERFLEVKLKKVANRRYVDVLEPQYQEIFKSLIDELEKTREESIEKQVKLSVKSEIVTALFYLTLLKDEEDNRLGMVMVIEDISDLLKVQRMMAWREVARRIAHEIKNPLTPIQLSAQHLRKRYENLVNKKGEIMDESTRVIINHVEELRNLVSEFSNFARLPDTKPAPNDLNKLVQETLEVFKGINKSVSFKMQMDQNIPIIEVDSEQLKRALGNVLDNAVAAVDGRGEITVSTEYVEQPKIARIEVADNGVGIKPEDKDRLFEPYFSTKKSGTGLGLSIVNTIISDHNGYIRIRDNEPRGTRFIIELPART